MSLAPHVLVPEPLAGLVAGTHVALPERTSHHLRRALRRDDGSELSLTDGQGSRASAELTPDGARLRADASVEARRAPQLVLAQSLAKGRRADDAVRMACELGVDRIVPVVADRTQGRPDERAATAVVDRWSAVAAAALEQSRGVHLTAITSCRTTADLADLAGLASPEGSGPGVRLVAVPGAPALPDVLQHHLDAEQPDGSAGVGEVWVTVGPEGGWSDQEVEHLIGSGWSAVGLGASVLRTEHAGPVAIAVVAALAGRWRGRDGDPGSGSAAASRDHGVQDR